MVKTPKTRHSKNRRDPVTIELEPGEVSRIDETGAQAQASSDAQASTEATAETGKQPPEAVEDSPAQEAMRAEEADFEPWEHDEAARVAAEHEEAQAERSGGEAHAGAASQHASGYGFDDTPPSPASSAPENESPASSHDSGAAATAPQPPRRKGGGIGSVAAGLIGGVVALAGAGVLQYAGVIGAPGAVATNTTGIDDQIADLRGQLTALKNAGDGGLGMKVDNLSTALDQVKTDVAALQAADGSGGSAGDNQTVSALSDKVADLEKAVEAAGQNGTGASADLGPVNEKLAALDALVKSAGEASSAQESKLSALEQSVSQLSAKVDAQSSQPKIALAIAASALKSALDRGGPFAAELDTFAAITPDAPEIAALRPYADKGVPTRTDIAGQMSAAANAMVAAAKPVDANAGVFQRLLSSAESLVKVRPIGAVEGKGVPETVARMEAAVRQGDYTRALAEYDTLPDAVKAAGAGFAEKLKARLDVESRIDALISSAMKA